MGAALSSGTEGRWDFQIVSPEAIDE